MRRGTAAGALALGADPAIVAQLEAVARPDPSRADEIAAALRVSGTGELESEAMGTPGPGGSGDREPLARRIWPHLRLVLAVTTGAAAPYADRLRAGFLGAAGSAAAVPVYSPVYAASEGLLGVNLDPLDADVAYALPPRAAFFEFIPVAEAGAEAPATLLPEELLVGEEYELVVTNLAGLWRYRSRQSSFGAKLRAFSRPWCRSWVLTDAVAGCAGLGTWFRSRASTTGTCLPGQSLEIARSLVTWVAPGRGNTRAQARVV